MLKELHIWNYRLFDELTIPDLGQVNLIAGKNNTGKTALLEALRIWAAEGNNTVLNHLLKTRGQFTPALDDSYRYFFNSKKNEASRFLINNICLFEDKSGYFLGKVDYQYTHLAKQTPVFDSSVKLNTNVNPDFPQDQSIFVPFNGNNFPLQALWDKIVLTPLENDVLTILKIVEPRIQRIDVKEERSRVLLESDMAPVALKSLGEGINRMLWIAAALVSAKNSLLLIDEFEAGLHHSVQEMLWEKIFFYAQKWNIQVFATTHSLDTVRTFQSVANHLENKDKGRFFRLQRGRKGQIEAIVYDQERLETAIELELEPR